jgi:pimeloyl-ACP methyl ester carboxylesterase
MAQLTTASGITLEYETFGSPSDPPLLMVPGFGMQLIEWPLAFCELLAAGGRHVIAFDNRDCGLSQKFEGQGAPIEEIVAAAGDAEAVRGLAPYTFSDMSDDAFGLLIALGIERAHVLGVSMGGMIAQTMAIEHPERVLTLTSIMSNTGEPEFGQPTEEALAGLLAPPPPDRDSYIASSESWLVWHSKRYPEAEEVRALAAESYDRCYYPPGNSRQLAAMVASGSRAEALARLQVPTLVIHGLDDVLIAPDGGERTAALVPGAELLLVQDMGHDRPRPLWPLLRDAILAHTA